MLPLFANSANGILSLFFFLFLILEAFIGQIFYFIF